MSILRNEAKRPVLEQEQHSKRSEAKGADRLESKFETV